MVGTLEPETFADLVVVDGDPTRDVAVLQYGITAVMKGGRLYDDLLA